MRNDDIAVGQLAVLLGKKRYDQMILRFIDKLGDEASFIVDKEDEANSEYIEVKGSGLSLLFKADIMVAIFLYSHDNDSDYQTYPQPLPANLQFGQSKPDVVRSLGHPASQGGGKQSFFGFVPEWLKYACGNHSLHLEFSPSSGLLQMVTLMKE